MALYVITGPPASGKSTFIQENAQPGDIRIDLDRLANHLAGLPAGGHEHDSRVWAVAKAARTVAIDTALKHSVDLDVWIIDSKPTAKNLAKYREHDAQIHLIDPGKDIVMSRCKAERPTKALKVAALWYTNQTSRLTIKSFAYGKQHPNGLVLDARNLPNPHDVPGLRIPDGTSQRVGDWLNQHDEVHDFIDQAINHIDQEQPKQVWVGCSAGKHRSVYIAEQLANHYGTTAEHAALKPKSKTKTNGQPTIPAHKRGYGWQHRNQKRFLLAQHRDGAPCQWCGKPMYKDDARNFDGAPLEADHTKNIAHAGQYQLADRLLHRTCNRQRGDNPALTRPPGMAKLDEPEEAVSAPAGHRPPVDWS